MFFLSRLSFLVGIIMLYCYSGESHKIIHLFLEFFFITLQTFHLNCVYPSKPWTPCFKPLFLLPTKRETCTGTFLHCSTAKPSKDMFNFHASDGRGEKIRLFGFLKAWEEARKFAFLLCLTESYKPFSPTGSKDILSEVPPVHILFCLYALVGVSLEFILSWTSKYDHI